MKDGPNIARIASLIGDPTRTEVLTALMGGKALTATELADIAGVTRQTISAHLAKLLDAQLITVESQGRHRYFRLAEDDVAHLLESMMGLAYRTSAVRLRGSPRDPAMRMARVCYDHLAGEISVQIYERLVEQGSFTLEANGIALTNAGQKFFKDHGIDSGNVRAQDRALIGIGTRILTAMGVRQQASPPSRPRGRGKEAIQCAALHRKTVGSHVPA